MQQYTLHYSPSSSTMKYTLHYSPSSSTMKYTLHYSPSSSTMKQKLGATRQLNNLDLAPNPCTPDGWSFLEVYIGTITVHLPHHTPMGLLSNCLHESPPSSAYKLIDHSCNSLPSHSISLVIILVDALMVAFLLLNSRSVCVLTRPN